MAVSSWWHKFPNFRNEDEEEEENLNNQKITEKYSNEQIDKDFSNTISLLKNSIYNIENVPLMTDKTRKDLLEVLLDQENILPKDLQKFVFFLDFLIY